MPADQEEDVHESERQKLLEKLLNCVQKCQIRFGGRKSELATEEEEAILHVTDALEIVLEHGLKDGGPSTTSLLARLGVHSDSSSSSSFWPLIKQHLSKSDLERFYLLKSVNCDRGRARAWLRSALNEHALERHLAAVVAEPTQIAHLYQPWAFLLDEERASILPSMSAGLSSILFALQIDRPALNGARLPTTTTMSKDREIIALPKTPSASPTSSPASSVPGDKKKRKVQPQIVNFDGESGTGGGGGSEASTSSSSSSSQSLAKQMLKGQTMNKTNLVVRERQSRSREKKDAVPPPHDTTTSTSKANHSDDDIYSTAGSQASRLSTDQDPELEPCPTDATKNTRSSSSFFNSNNNTQAKKLTPMKNSGIGALIPVGSLALGELDGQSEDSLSIRSYGEESDYASACSTVNNHLTKQQRKKETLTAGAAARSQSLASGRQDRNLRLSAAGQGGGGSSQNSSSTLSREDLKQALLSVMERKDELQVRV